MAEEGADLGKMGVGRGERKRVNVRRGGKIKKIRKRWGGWRKPGQLSPTHLKEREREWPSFPPTVTAPRPLRRDRKSVV